VKLYPTAGHESLDEEPPDVNPVLGLLLQRAVRFGPDPEAAADAWARIDAFLREHLAARAGR
jgi:carboxymethylenebutenolidase